MINPQSAARNTSSSRKQNKNICQLRTTRSLAFQITAANDQNDNGDVHHSNNHARLPLRLYFPIEPSRGRKPPADAIPGRMHVTGFLRRYRLCYNYDLRVAQFSNRNDFSLVIYVEIFLTFGYTLLIHASSQIKSVCEIEHESACVFLLLPILLAQVQTMSMCTLEAVDSATRNAAVWLFRAQSGAVIVIHYLLVLVIMRALLPHVYIHVRTCTYQNSINKYTTQ